MVSCCFAPSFVSLNVNGTSEKVLEQLNRRPTLVCSPAPSSALSGLHDTALHIASEHKRVVAIQQIFHFLAISDLATAQEAVRPYCRRAKLPPPANTTEARRLVANMTNAKGQTALMYASYADCPEIVTELLRQGADPWAADRCGCRNAMHYAAMAGSASCVEALMKHTPPNLLMRQGVRYIDSRSLSGLTPLHYSAFYEREAAVRELLRYEPNINAASTAESFDVWVTYDTYCTPLHFAAYKDCTPIARMLLFHYALRRRTGAMLDPRLRCNSANKLPWQVAQSRALATMLHPALQLRDALGPELDAALAGAEQLGPPPLAALAAAALRQKLLHSVEAIERECIEGDEMERAQSVRRKTMLLCGTPRRGGALPNWPSVPRRLASYRLAGGMTGGSTLPSEPHRAPTLDRLDGPLPHPPDTEPAGTSADGTGRGEGPQTPSGTGHRTRPPSPSGRTSRVGGRPRAVTARSRRGLPSPTVGGGGAAAAAATADGGGYASGGEGANACGHTGLGSPTGGRSPFAAGGGGQAGRSTGGGGGAADGADGVFMGESPDNTSQLLGDSPTCSMPVRQARELKYLASTASGATARGGSPSPCGGSPSRPGGSLSPAASVATPASFAAAIGQQQQQQQQQFLRGGAVPGNGLMPAASLIAGSIVFGLEGESDAGVGPAGVVVKEEERQDEDDDDDVCKVCFVRQETVAPATCRHGLCAICAGELCRAVVSKPLLCPFCRQPVTDFVRVLSRPQARRG